jgi:di/tricarboxylate transporter
LADSTISFAVLGAVVVLFVWNRLPVEIVAVAAALALYATGVLDLGQTLAGFGDPMVVFIAALFVVSEGLDATGVTAWAGQRLIALAGESGPRLLVLVMALSAGLTALISINGAVAALLPVVVVAAIRLGRPTSQLLLPLAFAAHAGSLLALTGTPVNVIVSEAATNAGEAPFGYFEFALVGIPLVAGTLAIAALAGPRLLPARSPKAIPADLGAHARTLMAQYATSDLELTREQGAAEVVIPPRSDLIGLPAFPGMVTDSGDLVIAAIQRAGQDQGDVVLAAGDALLLEGAWDALERNTADSDVLLVDHPELVRRQAVPMGARAKRSLAILAAMVLALATGVAPSAVTALVAACAMVLAGVLSAPQAYRAVAWTTVVLIGAMIPLSTAMQQTGAAAKLATVLVDAVGDAGPHALLVGLFLLTAILGQIVSNSATALIVIPIAVSAAGELGVSPRPLLMTVTVAAAASFLTPVATPVNLMVMGPGGYRFGDYWKLGLPLLAWFFAVAVLLIPVFWPF